MTTFDIDTDIRTTTEEISTKLDNMTEFILDRTSSGGASVNHTLLHLAVPDLPFGGVGPSGMGSYHGEAGFQTFPHNRSVMHRTTWSDPIWVLG